jgi:hypothetical protein
MQTVDTDAPMNCAKCAEWFGENERTIQRWARDKRIPSKKIAGAYFFLRSELVEFLRQKDQGKEVGK